MQVRVGGGIIHDHDSSGAKSVKPSRGIPINLGATAEAEGVMV
jgi:hypothetical protein